VLGRWQSRGGSQWQWRLDLAQERPPVRRENLVRTTTLGAQLLGFGQQPAATGLGQ